MTVLIFGGGSDMAPAIADRLAARGISTIPLPKAEVDVRSHFEVERAIQTHSPDVVINLAGISHLQSLFVSDIAKWREEIEINLIGSYHIARVAASKNIMSIFIGSVAGKYGKPHHSGYCASKAGVISLVQSLGMEGYKAYCISPGRVDTKMREKDFPGERKETRLEPREIAEVIEDILDGKYTPGDNIIIRRKGTETQPIKIDQGSPWKEELQVGQPPLI